MQSLLGQAQLLGILLIINTEQLWRQKTTGCYIIKKGLVLATFFDVSIVLFLFFVPSRSLTVLLIILNQKDLGQELWQIRNKSKILVLIIKLTMNIEYYGN